MMFSIHLLGIESALLLASCLGPAYGMATTESEHLAREMVVQVQGSASSHSSPSCRVGSTDPLHRTLCSPISFIAGLSAELEGEYRTNEQAALELAKRVWTRDSTLGVGIPWDDYARPDVRAMLAGILAPHARAGRSEVSLLQLQAFSIEYLANAFPLRPDDRSASRAIGLLGSLDTPGQALFLSEVIRGHPGQLRFAALMALGKRCDLDSHKLLESLPMDLEFSTRERTALEFARRFAQDPPQTMLCRSGAQGK